MRQLSREEHLSLQLAHERVKSAELAHELSKALCIGLHVSLGLQDTDKVLPDGRVASEKDPSQ